MPVPAANAYELALADAERCIELRPDWAKGHTRKAAALHGLKQYLGAIASYDDALRYLPGDETVLLARRRACLTWHWSPIYLRRWQPPAHTALIDDCT